VKALLLAAVAALTIGAAPVDWTKTVTRAPNGAYVLGNPKAKVRLVEYLSYSCSHCAHFSGEASAPLKTKYVSKGTVSVEFRNAVRDRFDFAAALLARCGGGSRFHGQSEALFAAQGPLLTKAQAFEASNTLPENAPINDALTGMAKGSGMTDFMAARGVPAAAANACLTNKAEQDVLLGMAKEAWEVRKLKGTPTFLINGRDIGPADWATVEPKLKAAIAAR
jgi:protein-disulfide isomerase